MASLLGFFSHALGCRNLRNMQIRQALSPAILTEEQFFDEKLNTSGQPPKKHHRVWLKHRQQPATRQSALLETSENDVFANSWFGQWFPF